MHSSVLRRLTVVAGCSALAIGLAGCSDLADPTGGLAIVVGARSNMPTPTLDGEAADALDTALDAQSYLAIAVADGDPFLSPMKGQLLITGKNGPAQEASKEKNRQMVAKALAEAAAKTPETDLLGALDLGARAIADSDGGHTIVVVDSGLSTVAPLDFTQPGMLDADPAELVASLQAADELPDLTGDAVVFQGLGDTADPQPTLTRGQRKNLVEIWTAIATAAGASSVDVEQSPLSGDAAVGLPDVSVVPLPAPMTCTAGTVTLAGGNVAFVSDSAAFLDTAAATDVVRPIAQQIVDGGLTATVTGTTADVGDAVGQQALSQQRAEAVMHLLVDLGVPADALTVRGLGSDFPGYVTDHDPAGNLVPAAAAQNRKVVIELAGASAALVCS
ncbi:OmpA family protein [Modestobacter altitudinis]|uniref:OmpA family protein n=1 Tax=Modestobacter altitudinis TaxID=2213158 RepID=UPI00110CE59E|nr:OmpA family protein [Modestobacter altitudinis]